MSEAGEDMGSMLPVVEDVDDPDEALAQSRSRKELGPRELAELVACKVTTFRGQVSASRAHVKGRRTLHRQLVRVVAPSGAAAGRRALALGA